MKKEAHIFSIAAGLPFFSTLVDSLYAGKILKDFSFQEPLALTKLRIYTPTKRAARALRSAFIDKIGAHSVQFLPDIRPVGDLGWEQFFSFGQEDTLPPYQPIDPIERLLLLAALVQKWKTKLPAHIYTLFEGEPIHIPSSCADALWLARDLAELMDALDIEEVSWDKFQNITPDFVSQWWQITTEFLKLISEVWPAILKERAVANPEAWRARMLHLQTQSFVKACPSSPILAIGFPGLLGAVADLFAAICRLPQGAVVLPSIDYSLTEKEWEMLEASGKDMALCSHPHYAMRKFLKRVQAQRSMIVPLGEVSTQKKQREQLVWEALRPAKTTEKWHLLSQQKASEALKGITLIEAPSEREEALAIAVALRAAIEEKEKTAALVTNNRSLARRVVEELKRFGIRANDSAGKPLSEAPIFCFIRLLLDCIFNPGDPIAFLGLIKHPLLRLGKTQQECQRIAQDMDLLLLRSGAGRLDINHLEAFVEERLDYIVTQRPSLPEEFSQESVPSIRLFSQVLTQAIAPLSQYVGQEGLSISALAEATIQSVENLGRDEAGDLSPLYDHEAKEGLMHLFTSLLQTQTSLTFSSKEWPEVLEALLAKLSTEALPGGHPRLFIWGHLEARLQTVDTIILGGLNEGELPELPANGPFLSRTMKALLGLEPPEYKIGLAAYDFSLALGMDAVILSRALVVNNEPSIASRWLQRLEAIAGSTGLEHMRQRGRKFLAWAQALDQPLQPQAAALRPCPRPPLKARPRFFSITDIETLQTDPYALYAKRVLKLKPLEKLITEYGPKERGQIYHKILADFILAQPSFSCLKKAQAQLEAQARLAFSTLCLPADIEALWLEEFLLLIPAYIQWEAQLSARQRYAEVEAVATQLDTPTPLQKEDFWVYGRADRIDILADGSAEIFDFKTSSQNLIPAARKFITLQLPLEGALLRRGAFEEAFLLQDAAYKTKPLRPIHDLAYVKLGSRGLVEAKTLLSSVSKKSAPPEKETPQGTRHCEEAWSVLRRIMHCFQDPKHGYLSHALKPTQEKHSPYDHLARVAEWADSVKQVPNV